VSSTCTYSECKGPQSGDLTPSPTPLPVFRVCPRPSCFSIVPLFEATREHNIDTDPLVAVLIAMAAPLSVGSSITVDGRDGVLQMEVCPKLTRRHLSAIEPARPAAPLPLTLCRLKA
jgi:hypothetical protein